MRERERGKERERNRDSKRQGCHKVNVRLANCRNRFKREKKIAFTVFDAVVVAAVVVNVDVVEALTLLNFLPC